jgi:hypothetical protein
MKATLKIEKINEQLQEWKDYFEDLSTKKQDKYDNASDSWQESDKGDECQDDITNIDAIVESLGTVIDDIETAYEV